MIVLVIESLQHSNLDITLNKDKESRQLSYLVSQYLIEQDKVKKILTMVEK